MPLPGAWRVIPFFTATFVWPAIPPRRACHTRAKRQNFVNNPPQEKQNQGFSRQVRIEPKIRKYAKGGVHDNTSQQINRVRCRLDQPNLVRFINWGPSQPLPDTANRRSDIDISGHGFEERLQFKRDVPHGKSIEPDDKLGHLHG